MQRVPNLKGTGLSLDQQVSKEGWSSLGPAMNTIWTNPPAKLWMLTSAIDFPNPSRDKEVARMEKCCGLGTVL